MPSRSSNPMRRLLRPAFGLTRKFLRNAGYRLDRLDQLELFEPILYRRLAKSPEFFFVQIGANDGIFHDPIRDFVTRNGLAGIAVEPLKDVYAQLVENYRDYPRVKLVNAAIHATAREMEIHRVDPKKLETVPVWARGIGSFRADHHSMAGIPGEVMTTETVACITLEELLTSEQVTGIDLLQIDTEGYDYEVIKMIDFSKRQPAIIHFEHGLPAATMSLTALRECIDYLMSQGYLIITEPYDAIAYRPEAI